MYTINLCGGIGNQLFQIAFLEYLYKHTGIKYYIRSSDISKCISPHSATCYFDTILSNWKEYSNNVFPSLNFDEYKLHPKDWIDIARTHLERNILFNGYFQNHIYITQEFINKLSFSDQILNKYPNIQNTVFLHVRGGDYVKHELHHVNLLEYYNKAIELFPKDTQFSIFTNDTSYANSVLELLNINHTIIIEKDVDTIYLMSKCRGGICANSSFSWWGARLNPNRQLIMPSKWFNDSSFYMNGYYFPEATIMDISLWDFIDKVVYINLDHRTDRNDHMKQIIRTFGNKVSRFSAIKNHYGAIGCSMSHIEVLKMAIQNKYENILVLEDDAEWNNFEEGYQILKKLASNPYDVIMLGGSFVSYNSDTYKLHSAKTTTGYLVNKHYMQTLLSNFEEGLRKFILEPSKQEMYAVDTYIQRIQPIHNWYIVSPSLLYQKPSYSDICEAQVDYRSLMNLNSEPKQTKLERPLRLSFLDKNLIR
jgi:glycosyl transferase family 25